MSNVSNSSKKPISLSNSFRPTSGKIADYDSDTSEHSESYWENQVDTAVNKSRRQIPAHAEQAKNIQEAADLINSTKDGRIIIMADDDDKKVTETNKPPPGDKPATEKPPEEKPLAIQIKTEDGKSVTVAQAQSESGKQSEKPEETDETTKRGAPSPAAEGRSKKPRVEEKSNNTQEMEWIKESRQKRFIGYVDDEGNMHRAAVTHATEDGYYKGRIVANDAEIIIPPNRAFKDPGKDFHSAAEIQSMQIAKLESKRKEIKLKEEAAAAKKRAAENAKAKNLKKLLEDEAAQKKLEQAKADKEKREKLKAARAQITTMMNTLPDGPQSSRHYNRKEDNYVIPRKEKNTQQVTTSSAKPKPKQDEEADDDENPNQQAEQTEEVEELREEELISSSESENDGLDDGAASNYNYKKMYKLEKLKLARQREKTTLRLLAQNNDQTKLFLESLNKKETLTDEQEDKKLDSPNVKPMTKTVIEAMTDDGNKSLTKARFLQASSDYNHSQSMVPKEFTPRTNYSLEAFGIQVTRFAAINRAHSRDYTSLQLKSYKQQNMKKVEGSTDWKVTSKAITSAPKEEGLRSKDDACLALLNYMIITIRICPANQEAVQLYSAVRRAQVTGHPDFNAADLAELFIAWQIKRAESLTCDEVVTYHWCEEQLINIVKRREAALTDSNKKLDSALAEVAHFKGCNVAQLKKTIFRTNSPVGGRRQVSNNTGGRGGQRGGRNNGGPIRGPKPKPARTDGKVRACRDYNSAAGCDREVTNKTCRIGKLILHHVCNQVTDGQACLGSHPAKDHP